MKFLKFFNNLNQTNSEGIFHCFTGNEEQANKIIDLNFILGIGGVVTFKNGKISEFLSSVPIDRIVLRNRFSIFSSVSIQREKE